MQDPQWCQCLPLTLDSAAAFTSNSTPASIHSLVRHSASLETEDSPPESTSTSTSTSLSTISCDSIDAIESWLDDIHESVVIVLDAHEEDQGLNLAQEPHVSGTRKRKHSYSSSSDEDFSSSSLYKRLRHKLQPVIEHAMPPLAADAAGAIQQPPTPSDCSSSHAADASTPTPSTSTKYKVPTDSGWVGRRLEMHGLHCDHRALKKYPEFRDAVLQIINGKRHSQMKSISVDRVQHYNHMCEETNEATLLGTLLPLIFKPNRRVKLEHNEPVNESSVTVGGEESTTVTDPKSGEVYSDREWREDGVFAAIDHEFRKDLLPNCYTDELLAQAMKKDDNMLTSRPDRCYGLEPNWIQVPQGMVLNMGVQALIEACPHISHPFFLIEGKSNRGDRAQAQNQARRGGASLVNAARQLLIKIGDLNDTDSGVDEQNFVFSATLAPGVIDFWIHWVEVKSGLPNFHMNKLTSLALDNENQIPEIRKIVNNILSWGCNLKARRLQELHEKVFTWQSKEIVRLREEAQQKDAEKKANQKRLRI